MSDRPQDAAWSAFWGQDTARGTTSPGCLPRGGGLAQLLSSLWRQFAATLPVRAEVLEVGTGDGRVMGWMRSARADLQLQGVDLADALPPPPAGTRSHAGVAMEQLPFEDGSFAAAVSQFGFEYGNLHAAAAELARVLVPDGTIALVTHRTDGPIMAQNVRRREGIRWAICDAGLPAAAREAIERCSISAPVPPAVASAPARGAELFGPKSAAWEIAEAIRMTLDLGRSDDPTRVCVLVDQIEAKANAELARIDALEAACTRIGDAHAVAAAFEAAGLAQREVHPLRERAGILPFADFRLVTRVH